LIDQTDKLVLKKLSKVDELEYGIWNMEYGIPNMEYEM
jgi:hypothetical protein